MSKEVEDFLEHHGVKGMHWGVRNDRNPNYDDQQVKRDKQLYGNRGSKRINKSLNKGDRISVARGREVTRRNRVLNRNPVARQTGKITGAALGIIATNVGISAAKAATHSPRVLNFLGSVFSKASPGVRMGVANTLVGARTVSQILNTVQFRAIASAGAAAIGAKLSGDAAVNINMRSHGYDPHRR